MDYRKCLFLICLFKYHTISFVHSQENELDAIRSVSSSLNQFALNFLTETANRAGDSLNLAISPYTVWSLMSIIDEGARGNTALQLENVLKIPSHNNKDSFRHNYKSLTKYLQQSAEGVYLDLSSAIFTTKDQNLNRTFQAVTKNFYGVDIIPTDFQNIVQAVNSINSYVSSATKNRIENFVKIDDVINAVILMTSTLFFKGQWQSPFNKSETFTDTFLDISGNSKGEVVMMKQVNHFPYSILPNLKAHAIELPYGNGDRISMIVILPKKGEPLTTMLNQLATIPFNYVLNALSTAQEQYSENNVEVYLPRFTINSDLNLNEVLDHMGIKDVFNQDTADLLGIFPHYLYLSRVIQQALIEVNEEGTVVASAAGGNLQDRIPAPKFYANREFAYFIIDKSTDSIIFEGKFSNPNSICGSCSKRNN